jgi:hypothetical protein
MFLTNFILNLWDPEAKFREDNHRITFLQIITLPLFVIGLIISFPIDILILTLRKLSL